MLGLFVLGGSMRFWRWSSTAKIAALALTITIGWHQESAAAEFMPVSEVKTGMQGYAKTVMQGYDISTFDVKVLGIMKNKGPSGDLILAEFSGAPIEQAGGIAHGMSGSPVYINDKLVGAVAYGWGFQRTRFGMITPIEQMVQLWQEDYVKNSPSPWRYDDKIVPLGTPFMAYGFDKNALEFLQTKLSDYKIEAYDTASSADDEVAHPLEPGSSVAATLIDGDLRLGAIGTVTYTDNDKIVAFGHPYIKEGNTGYFMHNSYIFSVVNSIESPFKLGSIGKNIGVIDEDRGAGIAGKLGQTPDFIPVEITTHDVDRDLDNISHVRVVKDNNLTPSLLSSSVYNFLTKTMDRKGGGTATITYTIKPTDKNLPPYERKDMFYSANGIALKSIDEFYDIADRLINNSFLKYDIANVDVKVDVTQERKTAQILDATASSVVVSPGDHIKIGVNLLPYRGEKITKVMMFKVPEDQPLGEMILEVRGGGVLPLPYLLERQKLNMTDEVIRRMNVRKNFTEFFSRLKNIDANNQIIVEILNKDVSMIDDESEDTLKAKLTGVDNKTGEKQPELIKDFNKSKAISEPPKDRSVMNTDYVIFGDGQFNIQVVDKKDKAKAIKKIKDKRKTEEKSELPKKIELLK